MRHITTNRPLQKTRTRSGRKIATRIGVAASVLATTVAFTAAPANAAFFATGPDDCNPYNGGDVCHER